MATRVITIYIDDSIIYARTRGDLSRQVELVKLVYELLGLNLSAEKEETHAESNKVKLLGLMFEREEEQMNVYPPLEKSQMGMNMVDRLVAALDAKEVKLLDARKMAGSPFAMRSKSVVATSSGVSESRPSSMRFWPRPLSMALPRLSPP